MAPRNLVPHTRPSATFSETKSQSSRFSLSLEKNISLDGITLLSHFPNNVTLPNFSSIPHALDTDSPPPRYMLNLLNSNLKTSPFLVCSWRNPMIVFFKPIGKLIGRKYLSIFRFKTWWSTMWVGSNGSDLQMET